eukprot:scaffold4115_cov17-Prasinocladus_malaysianus.AAC.1
MNSANGRPGGSFGNGGAMRIAPVGFLYRNKGSGVLRGAVKDALLPTGHTHEVAIEGAYIMAFAIKILSVAAESGKVRAARRLDYMWIDSSLIHDKLTCCCVKVVSPQLLLKQLLEESSIHEMSRRLTALIEGLEAYNDDRISDGEKLQLCLNVRKSVAKTDFQMRADDAVATSLWAFCSRWEAWCVTLEHKSPVLAITNAVAFGGDTDTIAAMTGALVGAYHGSNWVPPKWFDALEDQKHGKTFLLNIARRLAETELAINSQEETEVVAVATYHMSDCSCGQARVPFFLPALLMRDWQATHVGAKNVSVGPRSECI